MISEKLKEQQNVLYDQINNRSDRVITNRVHKIINPVLPFRSYSLEINFHLRITIITDLKYGNHQWL